MKSKATILVLLLGLICILVAQDFKIAPAEGFVNDFANILSSETRIRLNDWAIELREKTGVDLAIGTFPRWEVWMISVLEIVCFKPGKSAPNVMKGFNLAGCE
jgi:hypothetical protein